MKSLPGVILSQVLQWKIHWTKYYVLQSAALMTYLCSSIKRRRVWWIMHKVFSENSSICIMCSSVYFCYNTVDKTVRNWRIRTLNFVYLHLIPAAEKRREQIKQLTKNSKKSQNCFQPKNFISVGLCSTKTTVAECKKTFISLKVSLFRQEQKQKK